MIGIITKGIGGLYTVYTEDGSIQCKARGIFRKDNIKPCIGDKVEISTQDDGSNMIEYIFDRETEMIRPKVSNVNQVIIVFSIKNPKINLDLLDRFIVLAEEVGLKIVICINKLDIQNSDINDIKEIYTNAGYEVVLTTIHENDGLEQLKQLIKGNITVFAGPSGVGKSSLVNKILGKELMETGEISKKIKRGKHTTRHSELIVFDEKSYIVDSPGFTSLSLNHIESTDLKKYFIEFNKFSDECEFLNCNHDKEKKCGIKNNINKGINEQRYNRYLFFYNELKGGK